MDIEGSGDFADGFSFFNEMASEGALIRPQFGRAPNISAKCTSFAIRFATPWTRTHGAQRSLRFIEGHFQGLSPRVREGMPSNLYYRWSKEFLEAGKKRLAGDMKREAISSEVTELRAENEQLKQAVAEMLLKNRFLKKP